MERDSNVVSMARMRGRVDETNQTVSIDVPRRRKRKKGWRDHVMLTDIDVMARLDMTGSEWRVLHGLMAFVQEKGGVEARVSVSELADRISMAAPNVSRIFSALRDRHIVRTLRPGVHEINPWLAYNGDFDSWNAETEKWAEPIWVRNVETTTGEVK
jgi:DNA-binding transcriptional ArsR family regulator